MSATTPIFLYGTLLDPDLFGVVGGRVLAGRSARLADHAVHWARDENFPLLGHEAGAVATGLIVECDGLLKARLDFYELGFGYTLEPRQVMTDAGREEALVYIPEADRWPKGAAWSLSEWQRTYGPLSRAAAVEYMRLLGETPPEQAAAAFPQIRARAASRLRAQAEPSPDPFGGLPGDGVVAPDVTRQPFTDYFGVREDRLSFPTFGGGQSETVRRVSWLSADAVTILPYDPVRDAVLVVRQFRHGAFSRGDPNPWCIEPVAGRIDAGETPEEAARREMLEETGLEAGEMHLIGAYYPTPGAVSEHLTSYVAIADLGGRDGRVGGEVSEAEDIMAHVVSFEALEDMAASGAANTGPLLLALFWLARHRERLRATD
ncbi:NUDIX domain-containing protein [Alphaproteobacteria bacterium GH1-50]|uniref:ADP-ribose pyrophosphatase n=1 Tax=Kangsaoukella pontilimi TaxID=2691042 RepID=A0A7C9IFL0_9RHOB|nr:NUDIX domain-containing protein [Kangsaoukella pontilimi]MXQ07349.1 NUDIX domain-containing protein [Kangsaoukella pontilimi]